MSLVNLSMKHGTDLAEAEQQLARTVAQVTAQFGAFVTGVEWADDRRAVKFTGPGVWVAMRVDEVHVHAEGDVPMISNLLGGGVRAKLEQALRKQFPKALPEK